MIAPNVRRWTLVLTALASFMASLDTLVVVTALPSIQRSLGAGLPLVQWTMNGYELAYAAGIITAVALGDRFGRRRVFVAGLVLFTLSSAACALAPSIGVLIAARTIEGLSASMVTPLSLTILSSAFPPERRGMAIGILGGIAGLAIAGGPLVGGAVVQGFDWHWIFWLNVPIGAMLVALSRQRLPESHGPATRLDPVAAALASGGAASVVWALVRAGTVGWSNPPVATAGGLGVALVLGFLAWERRVPDPMLPPRLFRKRAFNAAIGTGFLMMGAQFAAAFLITQYLQETLRYSPLSAGLHFLPMTATPLVVAPIAGTLADRIGPRPLLSAGMALQALGLAWFALAIHAGTGYGALILPLLVAGAGVSMPFATVGSTVLGAVAPDDMGKASGANSMVLTLGGAFGLAVVTAVVAGHGTTAADLMDGLRLALLAAAGLASLGAIAALAVGSRPTRTAKSRMELPASAQPAQA